MSIYNQLSEYWTQPEYLRSIEDIDKTIICKYNIYESYIASDLHQNEELFFVGTNPQKRNLDFIHNENTICLLFPEYGVRIACTRRFIKCLPAIEQILTGDWKDKENIFRETYFNDVLKKIVDTSRNIILNLEMESLLFNKPIKQRIPDYIGHESFQIKEVVCSNLQELILVTNKVRYDQNTFN